MQLAKYVGAPDEQLKNNEIQLEELVRASEAADLLDETGFKAITATKCLVACSHTDRVRSEAASLRWPALVRYHLRLVI